MADNMDSPCFKLNAPISYSVVKSKVTTTNIFWVVLYTQAYKYFLRKKLNQLFKVYQISY